MKYKTTNYLLRLVLEQLLRLGRDVHVDAPVLQLPVLEDEEALLWFRLEQRAEERLAGALGGGLRRAVFHVTSRLGPKLDINRVSGACVADVDLLDVRISGAFSTVARAARVASASMALLILRGTPMSGMPAPWPSVRYEMSDAA